jgi:hypothetical protein
LVAGIFFYKDVLVEWFKNEYSFEKEVFILKPPVDLTEAFDLTQSPSVFFITNYDEKLQLLTLKGQWPEKVASREYFTKIGCIEGDLKIVKNTKIEGSDKTKQTKENVTKDVFLNSIDLKKAFLLTGVCSTIECQKLIKSCELTKYE